MLQKYYKNVLQFNFYIILCNKSKQYFKGYLKCKGKVII